MRRAHWRTRAVLALAAGMTFMVCGPTGGVSASATTSLEQTFGSVSVAYYNDVQPWEAARMAAGGVRTVRLSFDWFGVEARDGAFNWSGLDRTVGALASQGIRAEPVLFGTPTWAVENLPPNPVGAGPGGPNDTAYPPVMTQRATRGWKRFVHKAVARYGPGGYYWTSAYSARYPGLPALPVTTWQVWNEPTIAGSFWPRPSVRRYGRVLELTSPVIRSVDPGARIALAGVPGHIHYHGITFINRLYRDFPHIAHYFDLVAFHPYSPTARGAVAQLGQLRRALRRDGDPHVPVWVSEIGWGSGDRHTSRLNKGLYGQGRMLRRLYTRLRPRVRRLRVWQVTWFDWRDPQQQSNVCTWCTQAGLIDWRGRRKPAWNAYRSFMGRLG